MHDRHRIGQHASGLMMIGDDQFQPQLARGLCTRCLVTVCTENHGGSKRLLRVRCAMRLSQLALFLLRGYAALTAFALILGWPIVAAVAGGVGMVNIGAMGWQIVDFGRLMHRIVETVAKQARLLPLEAVSTRPPQLLNGRCSRCCLSPASNC